MEQILELELRQQIQKTCFSHTFNDIFNDQEVKEYVFGIVAQTTENVEGITNQDKQDVFEDIVNKILVARGPRQDQDQGQPVGGKAKGQGQNQGQDQGQNQDQGQGQNQGQDQGQNQDQGQCQVQGQGEGQGQGQDQDQDQGQDQNIGPSAGDIEPSATNIDAARGLVQKIGAARGKRQEQPVGKNREVQGLGQNQGPKAAYEEDGRAPGQNQWANAGYAPQGYGVESQNYGNGSQGGFSAEEQGARDIGVDLLSGISRETEINLKRQIQEECSTHNFNDTSDAEEIKEYIFGVVEGITDGLTGVIQHDRQKLLDSTINDFLHYGPLQELLQDDTLSEIMVVPGGVDDEGNFLDPEVWVEREGLLYRCDSVIFDNAAHLRRIIDRMAERANTRCDNGHPMGSVMIDNGRARASFAVQPISIDGPTLSIRKYLNNLTTPESFIEKGAITRDMLEFLRSAIISRCPIIVSGGTGAGKTTFLNMLSGFVPLDERIILIEDAPELKFASPNKVRLESREANSEGMGEITIRDCVIQSLRMRPDRIIVGECRGAEAFDMLQAMQTNHPGSMTTLHANDAENAIERMCTMIGYAVGDMPYEEKLNQIGQALRGGLIVHLDRLSDGSRKCVDIQAVNGLPRNGKIIERQPLFGFDIEGVDKDGKVIGRHVARGFRPQLIEEKARSVGAPWNQDWFFEE